MDLAINMLVVAPLPCFSVRFSQAKENMTCCFGDGQRPSIFKSFPTIDETLPCLSVCVEWNQKAISVVRVKLPHRANLAVLWMTVKCPHVVEVYQCSRSNKPIKPRERLQRRRLIININRHECGRKRSQLFDQGVGQRLFEGAFNVLNRHAFCERMRLDFLADDVDTGGHGTLAPSNVSIGRMSAWRESFESVKRKYAKVLSTETVWMESARPRA